MKKKQTDKQTKSKDKIIGQRKKDLIEEKEDRKWKEGQR